MLIRSEEWLQNVGTLTNVSGKLCATLNASIGEIVEVETTRNQTVMCEVIGFDNKSVQLMPFQSSSNFRAGNRVFATGRRMKAKVGNGLLGRVLDALGSPIDNGPQILCAQDIDLHHNTPDPLSRSHILSHL